MPDAEQTVFVVDDDAALRDAIGPLLEAASNQQAPFRWRVGIPSSKALR